METINYYNLNAHSYIKDTINSNMAELYSLFEKHIKPKSTILDLGFGSARDLLYFKNKGYITYGIDPCSEFCSNAKKLGLDNIYNIKVEDMTFINIFDAIWASASLLHVKESNLKEAFNKCHDALKDKGILYASFKYGDFIGEIDSRYFVYLTEKSILNYIDLKRFLIKEIKVTKDVRPNKENELWLNVILEKNDKNI